MGGGVGLTWHSPVRIATDNSMFAMPETAIGFFTDVGASYFLPRIRDGDFSLGLYLGLTGMRVKSRDLVKYGLATHFVPQENMEHLHEMFEKSIKNDTTHEEIEHIVCEHSDPSAKLGKIVGHEEMK
jgi:3-hydroxyisobutyryl-CoA hydrolase